MIKMSNEPSNALTGTTEERQASLDELCRNIYSYRDLNSLATQAKDKEVPFKEVFNGFNSALKQPNERYAPDNKGLFDWIDKPGNPCILDQTDNIPQEDRLSPTFMCDGIVVDYEVPQHYRRTMGRADRYSIVYGQTNDGECIGVQGNWNFTNQSGTYIKMWKFTALIIPSIDCEEFFEQFCMRSFGVSTFDEYSEVIEEERARKEEEWANLQVEGNKVGADLVAF